MMDPKYVFNTGQHVMRIKDKPLILSFPSEAKFRSVIARGCLRGSSYSNQTSKDFYLYEKAS